MKFKKFDIKDKSKFSYWFWHWLAYNYTAVKLHAWRPKFLLHDIEKPWLKLIWGDYDKVKKWHREHITPYHVWKDSWMGKDGLARWHNRLGVFTLDQERL